MVGAVGIHTTLVVTALLLQVLFLVFFARHLGFAISAMRSAPRDLDAPLPPQRVVPTASVLVACKDEERVVEAMVRSVLAVDYPPELLQVIVVDDGSSDSTGDLLDAMAAVDGRLDVLHRRAGGGGKSGALNAALAVATGEIIVVFDADHHPRPDCLRRLVRHFTDPAVAAVQGRCEIRNHEDSPLARLVAIDYLAGYLVNEYGRQSLFQLPAYGGANCAVRATELHRLGGWNPTTVTEDTDLTMRLVLAGRLVRYDVNAVDREEAVTSVSRYWRQRYRWARGHQQVWRDYRRAVVRCPHLSPAAKVETVLFLLVFHLPALASVGLALLVLTAAGVTPPSDPVQMFVLWTLLFLGPLLEVSAGMLVARVHRRNALLLPLFLPIFFLSIAICTKAWIDGVLGRPYAWAKTERSAVSAALA